MANAGLLKEYRWAFGLDDVIDTVVWKGPVILGINWYQDMYNPVGGVVRKGGKLVGGHCLLAVGYRTSSVRLGGKPAVVLLNSWGPDWGTNGMADISLEDLGALLKENGEAAVPVRRSYGR
jgi:C1A family cysteine protease